MFATTEKTRKKYNVSLCWLQEICISIKSFKFILTAYLICVFFFNIVPIIQFDKTSYSTNEEAGTLDVVVMRTGDLRYTSSIRCYTRYITAQVERDFKERPDTDESLILFNPGENLKTCPAVIIDDEMFEGREKFRLKLGNVDKESRIGERNTTVITIVDLEDSKCQ